MYFPYPRLENLSCLIKGFQQRSGNFSPLYGLACRIALPTNTVKDQFFTVFISPLVQFWTGSFTEINQQFSAVALFFFKELETKEALLFAEGEVNHPQKMPCREKPPHKL